MPKGADYDRDINARIAHSVLPRGLYERAVAASPDLALPPPVSSAKGDISLDRPKRTPRVPLVRRLQAARRRVTRG